MQKNLIFNIWLIIWGISSIVILFLFDGVGDFGDGLEHYLFARYGHLHPYLFLDPWAKTGYTLFTWPFAQMGLKGVMFMNILSSGICMWLVDRICETLGIKFAWTSAISLSLTTLYFVLMYSGLTEHLFSLVLTSSIYLLLKNKWFWGTLLLSTLPFFRQEGYIIIIALIPFYLINRKLKFAPLLTTSFIIVALIGAITYSDFLWILHSNPYTGKSGYGSGSWNTYFIALYYNMGLINLILFLLGFVFLIYFLVIRRNVNDFNLLLVVVLPFLAFFFSHVVFWYYGIFNSYGLPRTLNCIAPLGAIIVAIGFSNVINTIPKKIKKASIIFLSTPFILYPIIPSPSSINNPKNFTILSYEKTSKMVCEQFKGTQKYIYFQNGMVAYYLDLDPFDIRTCNKISNADLKALPKGSLLFWEDRLTKTELGLDETTLKSISNLNIISEQSDGKFKWIVYESK